MRVLPLLFLFSNFIALAQNHVLSGTIKASPTYENIGLVWTITGDDNLNSSMTIEYKESGSTSFLPTYETMRANPASMVDGNLLNYNHHAGSIVGLKENTTYDIRLILTDSDGGSDTEIISVMTKAEFPYGLIGTLNYVVPGTGGGIGSLSDPYQGLQEAADNSSPGDVFSVAGGMYTPFVMTTSGTDGSPIIFTADPADSVIIDGNNTLSGVITLGVYNDSIQHLVLENIVIQNGKWGIDAQNTQFVIVRNCTFRDVDYGYYNRRENGWEHDQTVSDNYIYGRTAWPVIGSTIPSERGIDIRGTGNVIRYNLIRNFGDGVSTDGVPYRNSYALDIHNNDISYIGDDLIEVDGMVANTRVWRNKCSNGRMGMSLAPVFGGPCYVYRNVFNNMEISSYKMNRAPAGLVIIHNSAAKQNRGMTSDVGWHNTILRNNILVSGHYCFEEYGLIGNSLFDDWNYNAYSSDRTGLSGDSWFKWNGTQFPQITDLQTGPGIESNGMQFDYSTELSQISLPAVYQDGIDPLSYDFRLVSGSTLINEGALINNMNDGFVFDGAPDLGAYEYGQPLPHYGPRPLEPNSTTNILIPLLINDLKLSYNGFDIIISSEKKIYFIEVIDLSGKLLEQWTNNEKKYLLKTKDWAKGIYVIRINKNKSVKVVRS